MKRQAYQQDPDTTEPSSIKPSPSTDSIAATTFSFGESTSAPLSSTSHIPQQSSIRYLPLQTRDEVMQALTQPGGCQKKLHLNRICLDDDLIWPLIESNVEELRLQNCNFGSDGSSSFKHILEFLNHGNPSKNCFKLGVRFNNCMAQWMLFDESSESASNAIQSTTTLLFILSGDLPQQSFFNDVSSLIFLPQRSNLARPLSSECKRILKSIMSRSFPRLKHLLLKDINFDGCIEEFIPISQLSLDLIHVWNCYFRSCDLIWSAPSASLKLVKSMYEGKIPGFQFAVPTDGHTTQIIMNYDSFFLMPDSRGLGRGLTLYLEQDLSNSLSLDDISVLALLPSKTDSNRPLSSQSRRNLKTLMNLQYPNLKYLLFMGLNFDDSTEDFTFVSQPRLDLIYVWKSTFKTANPVWTVLCEFAKQVNLMNSGRIQKFQFAIPVNGHILRIVYNMTSSFLIPNSPDLDRGLILSMEQALPKDLPLDDISLLALLSPKADRLGTQVSSQTWINLYSMMNRRYPKLKYLFLDSIDFKGDIENFAAISYLDLDLIYLWNCGFESKNLIWSTLIDSMSLLGSLHIGKSQSFQFTIRIAGHTTQVICHDGPSPLMPNSHDLVHGLILPLGQNIPNDLSLDTISLLVFFPSGIDSNNSASSQSKPNLDFITSRIWPKLKYLLLKDILFDDIKEMYESIRHLNLDVREL